MSLALTSSIKISINGDEENISYVFGKLFYELYKHNLASDSEFSKLAISLPSLISSEKKSCFGRTVVLFGSETQLSLFTKKSSVKFISDICKLITIEKARVVKSGASKWLSTIAENYEVHESRKMFESDINKYPFINIDFKNEHPAFDLYFRNVNSDFFVEGDFNEFSCSINNSNCPLIQN